jgi:hypothetical protein
MIVVWNDVLDLRVALFWICLSLLLSLSLDFGFSRWFGKFVVSGSATAGHHHFLSLEF